MDDTSAMTSGEKTALDELRSRGGKAVIPAIVLGRLKARGLAESDPDGTNAAGRGYAAARLTAAVTAA